MGKDITRSDTIKFTLAEGRSSACSAPFAIGGGGMGNIKVRARQKIGGLGIKTFHVKKMYRVSPGNFAKVHCWIGASDIGRKSVHCDGINVHGQPIDVRETVTIIPVDKWKDLVQRSRELSRACHDKLVNRIAGHRR
jgi:hypothetical protein